MNLAASGNPDLTGNAQTPTPPATTETPSNDPAPDPAAATPKPAVPDTYTLKAPEGKDLDPELLATATPIFKELGLDNAAAQKLVDVWNKAAGHRDAQITNAIQAQGKQWSDATMADPELGPNIDRIKVDVGRALDIVLTPAEKAKFQTSMDQTMAGNNPDFIRTFWKLAQRAAPGTPVIGGGPATTGQSPNGQTSRPSAAATMWPDLPSRAS